MACSRGPRGLVAGDSRSSSRIRAVAPSSAEFESGESGEEGCEGGFASTSRGATSREACPFSRFGQRRDGSGSSTVGERLVRIGGGQPTRETVGFSIEGCKIEVGGTNRGKVGFLPAVSGTSPEACDICRISNCRSRGRERPSGCRTRRGREADGASSGGSSRRLLETNSSTMWRRDVDVRQECRSPECSGVVVGSSHPQSACGHDVQSSRQIVPVGGAPIARSGAEERSFRLIEMRARKEFRVWLPRS